MKKILLCFFVCCFVGNFSLLYSQEETTIKLSIISSTDDAEQSVGNNEMKLTSSDLEMVYDGTEEIDHYIVGMRFTNAGIPAGATITYADVKFLVKEEPIAGEITLTINGEKSANAETFSEVAGNISARLLTTASVEWSPQSWADKIDQNDSTPDLKTIIQEIVDLSGWESGNSIAIIISGPVGTGASRTAYAFDDEPELVPILTIKYTVPAPGEIALKLTITASTDDAEQSVGNNEMKLTSSDLEMVYDGTEEIDHYIVGMRFANSGIPAGATITYADVKFLVKEEPIAGEITLTINGEKSANAETFSEVAGNISARLLTTASVEWSPQSWADLIDQNDSTPDLKTIIQEIIDLSGWESGNSIAIIISGPVGTGATRTAYAFDDEPELAPVLNIKYIGGGISGINKYESTKDFNLNVYPNPAMDNVTLEFGKNEKQIVARIYRMDGSIVFNKMINPGKSNKVQINVDGWANGTYIVVAQDSKSVISKVLIIE